TSAENERSEATWPNVTDGEGIERMWAWGPFQPSTGETDSAPMASGARQMPSGMRHSAVGDDTPLRRDAAQDGGEEALPHKLKIVTMHGVRDVECSCKDGAHSAYQRRTSWAFIDRDGHLVVKSNKTMLLPLN
ncbi:hypothetical protein C8R47DRAFT_1085072, partial [Mycena vitilis]